MWSSATRKMPTITRGAHTPKNTLEIMGTMAQVAAQGTAQAKAMVRIRWPQLSMTRVPAAPPDGTAEADQEGHDGLAL